MCGIDNIQGDSGGKFSILEGDSNSDCKKRKFIRTRAHFLIVTKIELFESTNSTAL
jgi:hypothetical protein